LKKIFLFVVIFIVIASNVRAEKLKLVFTGDNLLGARMAGYIAKNGYDFPYEFASLTLQDSDISFGNLECPLTEYPHATLGKSAASLRAGRNFIFKAPPKYAEILPNARFDIMTLANNHMMDYRAQGLLDTMAALKAHKILYVGAGKNAAEAAAPAIITEKGYRVGYLGYTMVVPGYSKAGINSPGLNTAMKGFSPEMADAIKSLKTKADIVVVTLHWGTECMYYPNAYHKVVAHKLIDAGADIVIGHHPHRIQGIEIYKGKVIAYSLGNFLFTGKSSIIESMILRVVYEDYKLNKIEIIPAWDKNGRPIPEYDPRLINRITSISKGFGTKFDSNKYSLTVKLP